MFCISKEYWESWVWRPYVVIPKFGGEVGSVAIPRFGDLGWVWEAVCSDSWVLEEV